MRKQLLILAVLALTCTELTASKKMDIKTIASGYFSAKTILGIDPIPGTDQYARISDASHVSIYDLGALLDELHAIRDDQLAIRDDDMVRLIGQMNRIIKNL